ncbi:MAG: thioredoxin family protein [Tannerellaceae bacterium]|jgi:thioredoxin|nr:thioredoxin family protein [Tannerellaceae bacterium]
MREITQLTKSEFLKKVANYEANPAEWTFEGERPCIVDFYADRCGPSRMIASLLDELAEEYAGKIEIYKVNTDEEEELIADFGIHNTPSLLFCPMNKRPQMARGNMSKRDFKKAIEEVLLSESTRGLLI